MKHKLTIEVEIDQVEATVSLDFSNCQDASAYHLGAVCGRIQQVMSGELSEVSGSKAIAEYFDKPGGIIELLTNPEKLVEIAQKLTVGEVFPKNEEGVAKHSSTVVLKKLTPSEEPPVKEHPHRFEPGGVTITDPPPVIVKD